MSKALTLCLLGTVVFATALLFAPAASAAEPDNDFGSATVIVPGVNGPFDISPVGDYDYYIFNLPDAGFVTLLTNGTSGDSFVYLYDGSQSYLDQDDDGAGVGGWSRIQMFLTAGDYYFIVSEYGDSSTIFNYTVELTVDAAVTLAEGLNGPFTIGLNGDLDYFEFDTVDYSSVKIELNGTDGDPEVYLYDEDMTYIAYADDGGTYNYNFPILVRTLPAGHYLVVVQSSYYYDDVPSYNITLKVSAAVALSLGLNGPFSVVEYGEQNLFRFDVTEPSNVAIQLNGTDGDPEVYLYDQNISYLDYQDNGGGYTYYFPRMVNALYPGSYVLVVQSSYYYDDVIDYNITLEMQSLLGIDGNGLRENATLVTVGMNGPFDIDPVGDLDWYVIDFSFAGIAELTLNGSSGSTVMGLYNFNGYWLAQDYYSGPGSFSAMQYNVSAATYYILVEQSSGTLTIFNYTLEIQMYTLPGADFNDDMQSAQTVTQGTTDGGALVTYDEDWYVFTATEPGTLYIETNGPIGGAAFYVHDSDGSTIAYSYGSGNFSFQETNVLVDAGVYYIEVYLPYSFTAVRQYNITIWLVPWVSVDGNDFRSQAQLIVQGLNGPWTIYSTSETDWYYFDTQQDGDVQVDLYATTPYYYYYPSITLYNETGSYIDSGNYQVLDNGPAARYYVQVSSSSYILDWYYLNLTYEDTVDPVISIVGPANGTQVDNGAVYLNGTTEAGAQMWVNGELILVNDDGTFSVLLPVAMGTNVFTIVSSDPVGNDEQTVLTVVGIDRNESLTNQLNAANQQLTNTQGQLTTAQQQLAAAQAAQAAAAAQASATSSQLSQTQSQLDAANGSIAAARAEADAQRGLAMAGMALAGIGLAAAAAIAVMMMRRRPPQAGPPVQLTQAPPQAPLTASYPVQPPTGGAPSAPSAPWPPQAPASPPASPPASGPSTGQGEHMAATAPAMTASVPVEQSGRPFGRSAMADHAQAGVHLEGKSAGADVPVDAGM